MTCSRRCGNMAFAVSAAHSPELLQSHRHAQTQIDIGRARPFHGQAHVGDLSLDLLGAVMSSGVVGISIWPTRSSREWPPEPDPSRAAPQTAAGLIAEGESMTPDEAYQYALAGLAAP